jgi:cyclophilin family peptidyl-prolyl cis-trans isomerase
MRTLTIAALASVLALLAAPAAPGDESKEATHTMVIMKTNLGEVEIELFDDKAPITVQNFLRYVDEGFYNGTIFHRVIRNFMIQGGGFDVSMQKKPTHEAIKNEADNGLKNETGTLAMARTAQVDSATAQFFINTKDNDFLNHGARDFGYAVFGKVTGGMEIVRQIEMQPTTRKGPFPSDVPVETVVIESITRK